MDRGGVKRMQLRPLSLGELLDRAVTLCVRHALTFALIFLVFIVPFTIFQTLALPDQGAMWTQLLDLARSGGKVMPHAGAVPANPAFSPLTGLVIAAFWLFSPLSYAALIVATSHAYLEGSASFGMGYRRALRVWPRLIGVAGLYFLAVTAAMTAITLVGIVIGVVAAMLAHVVMPLGIIFGVVFGGAFVLALLALGLVTSIACYLSLYTCILEDAPITAAFMRGLQRGFGHGNFLRSLCAALALSVVSIGVTLVSMAGAVLLFGLFHSVLLGQVFSALIQVPAVVFMVAFMALYYYDLRVRNEGFDLRVEMAAPVSVSDALTD